MAFHAYTSNNKLSIPQRRLNGFTLLEMLIVLAVISLLSLIAIPSFDAWNERNAFKHAATGIASLAKQARMKALINKKNMFLIAQIEHNSCVLVSEEDSCSCATRRSCALTESSFLSLPSRWNTELSTTNNEDKIVAFNKNGTLNFASNTTLTLSSQRFRAKLVINTLGRIKLCSVQSISGIAPC